ncbi:hypothetical protein, partial [Treponema socranskii]|uniref:hypothetical protein n=1 Tax=Treponema socranskii TaxID=53419 RepID=UPI0028E4AA68
ESKNLLLISIAQTRRFFSIGSRRFNLQRARSSLHSLQRVQGICATCGEREVPLTAYSERGVPRAAYNEREAFFKFKL